MEAAKNLCWHLRSGCIGSGVHRVPINGNVNLLPKAKGLTLLERRMATAANFIAEQLPGPQPVRLMMGRRQLSSGLGFSMAIAIS